MSAHRFYTDGHAGDPLGNYPVGSNPANWNPDPGNAGTILVYKQFQSVPLVSATTETRTLARPQKLGIFCWVWVQTYVGNITLTVTGNYNTNGNSTFVFTAAGQWAFFGSAFDGTNYYWELISSYQVGNVGALAPSAKLINATTTLTVTAAAHAEKIILLNGASGVGFASTMPIATGSGNKYTFMVAPGWMSTSYTIDFKSTTQQILGTAVVSAVAGGSGTSGSFATTNSGTNSNLITLNGTTSGGGFGGDVIECWDIAALEYAVRCSLNGFQTSAATPFSNH